MALGLDLQDCEAILLVEEGDALDQPGKGFGRTRGGLRRHCFQLCFAAIWIDPLS